MKHKFKVGDKVKIINNQSGNYIVKNSWGYVINIDYNRQSTGGYIYPIKIEYYFIPKRILKPENRFEDDYKGKYWTREDRIKLVKINWSKEI